MNPWTEPPRPPASEVVIELALGVALLIAVLMLLVP
jgi:hypothetical protein